MYPTPARLARLPWPVKHRLAIQRGISVTEYEKRALRTYRSQMAIAWWREQRAEKFARDIQPDYNVRRCPICGAWTLGRCTTDHGWRS